MPQIPRPAEETSVCISLRKGFSTTRFVGACESEVEIEGICITRWNSRRRQDASPNDHGLASIDLAIYNAKGGTCLRLNASNPRGVVGLRTRCRTTRLNKLNTVARGVIASAVPIPSDAAPWALSKFNTFNHHPLLIYKVELLSL